MSRVWPFPAAAVHRADPLDEAREKLMEAADEQESDAPYCECGESMPASDAQGRCAECGRAVA